MSKDNISIEAGRSGSGAVTFTLVQKLQRKAKAMGRAPGMPYTKALDAVAVEAGFHHWHDVTKQHKAYLASKGSTPISHCEPDRRVQIGPTDI